MQRYGVPCPQDNQFRLHDQAVYSMWMHFVTYCSLESSNSNNCYDYDAEMAIFAHPACAYPMKNQIHPTNSPRRYSPNDINNSSRNRGRCVFSEPTFGINRFINVERLNVFKTLSQGLPSNSGLTTEDSTVVPSSVSSANTSKNSTGTSTPTGSYASSPSQRGHVPLPLGHRVTSPYLCSDSLSDSPRSPAACPSLIYRSKYGHEDYYGASVIGMSDQRSSPQVGNPTYNEELQMQMQHRNSNHSLSHMDPRTLCLSESRMAVPYEGASNLSSPRYSHSMDYERVTNRYDDNSSVRKSGGVLDGVIRALQSGSMSVLEDDFYPSPREEYLGSSSRPHDYFNSNSNTSCRTQSGYPTRSLPPSTISEMHGYNRNEVSRMNTTRLVGDNYHHRLHSRETDVLMPLRDI